MTDYKKSGLKRKVFQEIINEDKEKNENFMKIININKDNSYKINDDNFADKTLLNNFRKNFSKEKTCYKTDIKNSENKFNDKKEEIGFETKLR